MYAHAGHITSMHGASTVRRLEVSRFQACHLWRLDKADVITSLVRGVEQWQQYAANGLAKFLEPSLVPKFPNVASFSLTYQLVIAT